MYDGRKRHPGLAARRAFTVVELIIVVAILGLSAALVVPQLASSDTFEVQGAARAVMSDLYAAQNEAIAQQAERTVVFDASNNSYRLNDETDTVLAAPWLGGQYIVSFGTGAFDSVSIASADFGGAAQVTFDELGTPDRGGTVELVAGSLRYRVTVTAFTGRVTVEQVTGG